MASVYASPVTAVQVGSYFLQQYYEVLQKSPDLVYQFYTDESTMIRVDGTTSQSASAMLQIHALVMSLHFSGIEIKTAKFLDSWSSGVLIMVSGSVQIIDYGGRRRFVQAFFLAPQEKGYFILNDIFHLLDEEEVHQHQPLLVAQNHFEPNANISNPLPDPDPVSDYSPLEEAQTWEFVTSTHLEENNSVDQRSLPEQHQHQVAEINGVTEESHVEDSAFSLPPGMNIVQDLSSVHVVEPVGEPQKHTYASILRVAKAQSTTSVAPQWSVSKIDQPTSQSQHVMQPTQKPHPATSMGSERSMTDVTEEHTANGEEGEGRSVYVRNLSSTVSEFDIEQEFKKFGIIKPDGVFLRNRKDIGVCYAFVEFEDVVSAQNAIEGSPIQLDGRQVYIEERRPSSSGISRGRGRGRGRGGYPTDASRGRFSSRTSGRGNGEGFDREYNRPRGNGYYRRGPTQDRGILGTHGPRNGQHSFEDEAS